MIGHTPHRVEFAGAVAPLDPDLGPVQILGQAWSRVEGSRQMRQPDCWHAIQAGQQVVAGHRLQSSTGFVVLRNSAKLSRRCSAARRARAQTVGVGLTTPPVVKTLPSTM